MKIMEYGKGRCQEFAILYVAPTLAHGYQSRLVIDMYGDMLGQRLSWMASGLM